MNKQEIIDGNRLTAEFMGMQIGKLRGWLSGETKEDNAYRKNEDGEISEAYSVSKLKYHESWDWLMPVVEKIETLNFRPEIKDTACFIYHPLHDTITAGRRIKSGTKMDAVYLAVVEFVKWYNQQPPQSK